jgi:hypothetical protein
MHQRSEPEEKKFSCTFAHIKAHPHWKEYAQRKCENEYDKYIMPLYIYNLKTDNSCKYFHVPNDFNKKANQYSPTSATVKVKLSPSKPKIANFQCYGISVS